MIGISKEKLANINPWVFETQQDLLNFILDSCKELDPWLPIEDAPKDRELWLYWESTGHMDRGFCNHMCGEESYPTHYKDLPEDPKERAK